MVSAVGATAAVWDEARLERSTPHTNKKGPLRIACLVRGKGGFGIKSAKNVTAVFHEENGNLPTTLVSTTRYYWYRSSL